MTNIIYGTRIKLRPLTTNDSQDIYPNIQDESIATHTPLKLPYSIQDCIECKFASFT
jgi:hypothetical protein